MILIVTPDPIMSEELEMTVENAGYTSEVATSLDAASDALLSGQTVDGIFCSGLSPDDLLSLSRQADEGMFRLFLISHDKDEIEAAEKNPELRLDGILDTRLPEYDDQLESAIRNHRKEAQG